MLIPYGGDGAALEEVRAIEDHRPSTIR